MVLERNWLNVYQRWEKWVGNKVDKPHLVKIDNCRSHCTLSVAQIAALNVGDVFTPKRMQLIEGRWHVEYNLITDGLFTGQDALAPLLY